MSTIQGPKKYDYDYSLGIDSDIIAYMRESAEVSSRISPVPCYLLQRKQSGSVVGSVVQPMMITAYAATTPNYRAVIWPSGSVAHPDLRPYSNTGAGSINVLIDGVQALRVIEYGDLIADTEFAVVERLDLASQQVELVFNAGFNPTGHTLQYYFGAQNLGIDTELYKRGDAEDMSLFGWSQYTSACTDAFRLANQILVRQPLTTRDLIINEEGRVTLEENECWMIWTPYVRDFDMLVVAAADAISGAEERYEVINKKDSVVQRTLITQRFKVKYLEPSDPRYKISYSIT